jgi:hypothetical protein
VATPLLEPFAADTRAVGLAVGLVDRFSFAASAVAMSLDLRLAFLPVVLMVDRDGAIADMLLLLGNEHLERAYSGRVMIRTDHCCFCRMACANQPHRSPFPRGPRHRD